MTRVGKATATAGMVGTAVAAEAVATACAGFLWLCERPLNGKLGDLLFGKALPPIDYEPTAAPMCASCGPVCLCK